MSHTVPLGQVESTLSEIWKTYSSKQKMRAGLFNLVVYTLKNARADYYRKIVEAMIAKFPSRVIFVELHSEDLQLDIQAEVSVLSSSLSTGEFACDSIHLHVGAKSEEKIPFTVLPYLLPDLPLYVLWGDAPSLQIPLLQQLGKYAVRIIFDSESGINLPTFAKTLLDQQKKRGIEVADLAWARVENWRELLSITFKQKEKKAALAQLDHIQLSYHSTPSVETPKPALLSHYLIFWMASQLRWKFKRAAKKGGEIHLLFEKNGKSFSAILSPEENPAFLSGAITRIEMRAAAHQWQFSRSKDKPQLVRIDYSTDQTCDLPFYHRFPKGESGQSLIKEVGGRLVSQSFIRCLEYLAVLPEGIE